VIYEDNNVLDRPVAAARNKSMPVTLLSPSVSSFFGDEKHTTGNKKFDPKMAGRTRLFHRTDATDSSANECRCCQMA